MAQGVNIRRDSGMVTTIWERTGTNRTVLNSDSPDHIVLGKLVRGDSEHFIRLQEFSYGRLQTKQYGNHKPTDEALDTEIVIELFPGRPLKGKKIWRFRLHENHDDTQSWSIDDMNVSRLRFDKFLVRQIGRLKQLAQRISK